MGSNPRNSRMLTKGTSGFDELLRYDRVSPRAKCRKNPKKKTVSVNKVKSANCCTVNSTYDL